MELSVIILSYNVRPYVWQCIDSVMSAISDIEAEVLLVDNASQDDTVAAIQIDFPQVKLLKNQENIGFAKAYNQAVKTAQGKYLCILNPDTVVGEQVFASILKFIEGKDKMGALGTQFIDGCGCFLPECKRVVPTPLGSLKKLLGVGGQKGGYYQDQIAKDDPGEAPILAGAFLFVSRSDYLSIDGFDQRYFMFGEDIDFCYKLIKKGRQNYYLGPQKIIHYKGESTQKNRQYLERFYGAMVHFYKTHFSESRIKVMAVSILAQGLIWWRSFWPKQNRVARESCDSVIWVSRGTSPEPNLWGWLKKKAQTTHRGNVEARTPEELTELAPKNALVIFDRAALTYDQIIGLMAFGAEHKQRFRIWHKNKGLLIGSDSSDAHGEAIYLDNEQKSMGQAT